MGVFKEEAHTFDLVEANQTHIYNDAADYGHPYDIKNIHPDIKALLASLNTFKMLDEEFPDEKPFIRNRQVWGDGVSVDVIIFWEKDIGYNIGVKYSISFNKTPPHHSLINKNCNAFISVYSTSYKEKS